MSIWDVVFDREQARKLWPDFLTAGQLHGACVVVRKDGTTRHVEFRARANVLPGPHVSSNHDITERKRAEEQARLLQSITLAVSAAHDFGAALAEAMKQVREATGWAFAEAWLPSSDDTVLERHSVSHSGDDGLVGFQRSGEGHTFAPGIGLPGTAWSTQRPVWIPDVTKDPRFDRIAAAQKAGLKAAMAVPALAGEEVVAVLSFFLFEPREEDERLVRVVQTIATQLGWVIQRRRDEEESHPPRRPRQGAPSLGDRSTGAASRASAQGRAEHLGRSE
jgi:transcriptional regulator with GAF, ATPase, and Fis domain